MQPNTLTSRFGSGLIRFAGLCTFILVIVSCKPLYVLHTDSESIDTSQQLTRNEVIVEMVAPYKEELDESMEEVVAQLEYDLVKEQPESTMGNHVAHIIHWKAEDHFDEKLDFSVSNYGGLRVPYIGKGALKVNHAYQIMPFDNYVVMMEVPGTIVKELIDRMAVYGGWPVHQLTFNIKDGKAQDILINGEPLNLDATYKFGITDYLANGGDKLSFLKEYTYENTNAYLRDAIIDFWKEASEAGRTISVEKDGRVKRLDE